MYFCRSEKEKTNKNMKADTTSSSDFIYQMPEKQPEEIFTAFQELPSHGFNILIKAKRFGKWFLLKGLKEEYREDPVYRKVLRKEFEIMASLSYPSVVSVFSLEQIEPYGLCIVMEYVDGVTLTEYLLQDPDRKERLQVFFKILDALRYIHSCQVTHRDLKPSNILVTHNNRNVKIIDFGLSDTDYFAILKEPAGTKEYMSPEQKVSSTPDVRNDIYSLGTILMQMQPGKSYQKIIRRCVAPIEQRYPDVEHLEQALREVGQRKKRRALLILGSVLLLLSVVVGWQAFQIRQLAEVKTLSADSLSALKRQLVQSDRSHTEKLNRQTAVIAEISDSLERMNALRQKWSDQEKHQQLIQQYLEAGQKGVEQLARSTGISQHLDTLSSIWYLKAEYYSQQIIRLSDYINNYGKESTGQLSENEWAQMRNTLYTYLYDHYTKRWNQKIQQLNQKQRGT